MNTTEPNADRGRSNDPSSKIEAMGVADIVQRLEVLYEETDPRKGAAAAVGKDDKAFLALRLAGELVHKLAAWAIDHQMGLAYEDRAYLPRPRSSELANSADYLASKAQADSHRHEETGIAWRRGSIAVDDETKRRFLANLTLPNASGLPQEISADYWNALTALDYGETRPILKARNKFSTRAKVNHTEYSEQLRAVCAVIFRDATGLMSIGDAEKDVADLYGMATDRINKWRMERVPSHMGKTVVENHFEMARGMAEHIAALRLTSRSAATRALENHHLYGRQALEASRDRFAKSKKSKR